MRRERRGAVQPRRSTGFARAEGALAGQLDRENVYFLDNRARMFICVLTLEGVFDTGLRVCKIRL